MKSYVFGFVVGILLVFGIYFLWNMTKVDHFESDQTALVQYCLSNHLSTNRINFPAIVKAVRKNAKLFDLDPVALYAVICWESQFQKYALNTRNKNGTWDYGYCQINSIWMDEPYIATNIQSNQNIMFREDINIYMGAYILFEKFSRADGDILMALTKYNGCKTTLYGQTVLNIYYNMNKIFRRQ